MFRSFHVSTLPMIVLLILATAVLGGTSLLWSASRGDQIAVNRQAELVAHLLDDRVAGIAYDQESVAIWDDTIQNTSLAFDSDWIDSNIGEWMHDYFGHDQTFILNENDQPIYLVTEGEHADPAAFAALGDDAQRLIESTRSKIVGGEVDLFHEGVGESPRSVDIGVVDGRPAIVSVMAIVSDSGELARPAGSQFVLLSVRFLDESFLVELSNHFLVGSPRFAWNEDAIASEASTPLVATSGEVVGFIVWRPDRPGAHLLAETAPILFGALLLFSLTLVLLSRRLKQTYDQLKKNEAEAQHKASHDQLTGLPNRQEFLGLLEHAVATLAEARLSIAVLIVDLDGFKSVNDALGHPAGDEVIRVVASRLKSVTGPTDLVVRLGGDEFAILRVDGTSLEAVERLCERVISTIGSPVPTPAGQGLVGASVGAAIAGGDLAAATDLVRDADIALYRAKAEGRNTFRVFDVAMDEERMRRQRLEADLGKALGDDGQLSVHYQPIYARDGSVVTGAEALLRWLHPILGEIPPSVFIPIAEESGLINALGQWMLREVMATTKNWNLRSIAVNASPLEIRAPGYAHSFVSIAQEVGADLRRFEIEITENVLIENAGQTRANLEALQSADVRLALDDFGTGYSSLYYLRSRAVQRVKIDRGVVADLGETAEASHIAQAILTLSHAMGLLVTAEGVESNAQFSELQRMGCDNFQGFLFSIPLSGQNFEALPSVALTEQQAIAG